MSENTEKLYDYEVIVQLDSGDTIPPEQLENGFRRLFELTSVEMPISQIEAIYKKVQAEFEEDVPGDNYSATALVFDHREHATILADLPRKYIPVTMLD